MAKIVTNSICDQIYEMLLDSIVSFEMPPGTRVLEEELAERFDVSRTPLREALHHLEQDGLVVRLPKRGLAVAPISVEEAKELMMIRSYVEGLAIRLTTERLTEAQVNYLKELKERFSVVEAAQSPDEMKKLGRLFHTFVSSNCGNRFCQSYISKSQPIVTRYKNIGVTRAGRRLESLHEHLHMIDCLIERDAEEAETSMRKHIEVSLNGSINQILLNQ